MTLTREEALKVAKPILFNTDMVRAILDDRKTATRRLIKLRYGNTHIEWHKDKYGRCLVEMQNDVEGETYGVRDDGTHWQKILAMREIKFPYKVGEILYVRETWKGIGPASAGDYVYKADDPLGTDKWHPSIHMPKEAARIFLRVTDVRVERLQDMKFKDFLAEGVVIRPEAYNDPDNAYYQAQDQYLVIWNSTIKKSDLAKYGWVANPWVTVNEFERLEVTDQ